MDWQVGRYYPGNKSNPALVKPASTETDVCHSLTLNTLVKKQVMCVMSIMTETCMCCWFYKTSDIAATIAHVPPRPNYY